MVSQGDAVNVRILEIDGERRRLSLSLKRVEEGEQPVPRADGAESVHETPDLRLSEEAFPTASAVEVTEEADEAETVEVTDDTAIAEADVEALPEAAAELEVADESAAPADEPAEEAAADADADSEQPDSE